MAAAGSAPLKPSRAARVSWIVFVRRVASSIVWGRCSLPGCGRVSRDNAGEIGQFFLARGACVVALMESIVQTGLITTTASPRPRWTTTRWGSGRLHTPPQYRPQLGGVSGCW